MLLFISLKQALLHILLICSTISTDDDMTNDIPQDEMSGIVNDHNNKGSKIERYIYIYHVQFIKARKSNIAKAHQKIYHSFCFFSSRIESAMRQLMKELEQLSENE